MDEQTQARECRERRMNGQTQGCKRDKRVHPTHNHSNEASGQVVQLLDSRALQ